MAEAIEDPRYREGMEEFRRGNYFHCHEVWESLWKESTHSDRDFVRGMIQAAVALHHAGNGNAAGAQKLAGTAEQYLGTFRPQHAALDIDRFLAELRRDVRARLEAAESIRAEGGPNRAL